MACTALLCAAFGINAQTPERLPAAGDTLIVHARVADGSGAPLRAASVRLRGDRIVGVGALKPADGDRIVEAHGLVLAPGFIDIHNHSDGGLDSDPLAETQISQGITSAVLGPDGDSPWPIDAWVRKREKNPAALNLAVMVGHATVREDVLGKDFRRVATPVEIERMAKLVDRGMRDGAVGLSSGLEYDIASYSATDEVIAMARAAAQSGGFYMTHVRDEADKSFAALDEEIAIGEAAHIPVEHSHIKLGTVGVWGKASQYIGVIKAARKRGVDFLADCYPYDAWHANIKVLVPDKRYEDETSVAQALADVGGAGHVTITEFVPNPAFEQHTIAALAKQAGITPVAMFIRLIREGDAANTEAVVIGQSMIEADIKAFYQQPWVMVASDGGIGGKHPRGAGTFPRVLGVFVREKHWLTLPEAIRKMTSLPAQRLGWKDRGRIGEGLIADLVLFNPDTVIDRSTFARPTDIATGIQTVFVNGVVVWNEGRASGARPGRIIRP